MKRMCVSFSGGRTSAFMAKWLLDNKSSEYEFLFLFANTGQEHEKTLDFVNQCDKEFGLRLVWIEADVYHGEKKGSGHKIVCYKSASRDGRPFEEVIKKYGIPNQAYPHCTRELKLNPIKSYIKSIGWDDCLMAVGIRADEIDRMSYTARENGIIYPLISMRPTTKEQVIEWWSNQGFDLQVPERLGNCVWCWKKTTRKHLTNIASEPDRYDFPERMERLYGLAGHNVDGNRRVFFRGHKSTADLREMASRPFVPFAEYVAYQASIFDDLDVSAGCSESCEFSENVL